ncbi:uncharacterized protein, partial [Miscanthus floridulus]|uniref:uncharacterized protein n=1 Tax=Miscanthus floridulus TaxID=154761 RepID=UPI00345AB30B
HEVNFDELPYDPADRRRISDYIGEKLQNEIRRKYLIRGPFRPPPGFNYPQKIIAGHPRRFRAEWYTKYDWLEYSEKVDKCFCLYCYLFRDSNEGQGGNDAFAKDGWDGFNKLDRLQDHVGTRPKSFHNTAIKRCNNLMKPDPSIANVLANQRDVNKKEYLIRLNTSIDAVRFLLHQGLAFRGHNESETSKNKENFRELVRLLAKQNDGKEQMAVVLRYVDKSGLIKERLIGIVHVSETSASCLKSSIDILFGKYGLSIKQVRGQGYDGASNMRVAKKNDDISDFFDMVSLLINVAEASCKRKDMIRESQQERVAKAIGSGQLSTGTGLNQEQSLQRAERGIPKLDMEQEYIDRHKPRKKTNRTNYQHYKYDCLNPVIDLQLAEFNDHFNEVNSELLTNIAAFSLKNYFDAFKIESLMELTKAYPNDFDPRDLDDLIIELNIYIDNVRADAIFAPSGHNF